MWDFLPEWLDDPSVIAALVGVIVTPCLVAYVNHKHHKGVETRKRREDRLKDQIQKLYGPLFFYAGQMGELLKCRLGVIAGTNKLRVGLEEGEPVEEAVAGQVAMDEFWEILRANNRKMADIIEHNYAYVDLQDVESTQQFVAKCNRAEIEARMPDRLRQAVGIIQECQMEFAAVIHRRFQELAKELASLTKPAEKKA